MARHSLSASFLLLLLLVPFALLLLALPFSDSTSLHLSTSRPRPAHGIFPFAFRQLAAKASKKASKKAPAPVNCQSGWIYNSKKKSCYRIVPYCKYAVDSSGNAIYSLQNYTLYQSSSGSTAFSLPSLLDAAVPNEGEYVLNGLCTLIVDSSCRYVGKFPGDGCHGCCYISSSKQTFPSIPCFDDSTKSCDVTFSPNSAACGDPGVVSGLSRNTTICNACTPLQP